MQRGDLARQARRRRRLAATAQSWPGVSTLRPVFRISMHWPTSPPRCPICHAGERAGRARALLARVNMEGLEARRPSELSGGQRQRVALARALARDPQALLLDEPFSAVDQLTRRRLRLELAQLRREIRIPMVLVTHDLDEAQLLGDRLSVLHHGRTLQTGDVQEVMNQPARRPCGTPSRPTQRVHRRHLAPRRAERKDLARLGRRRDRVRSRDPLRARRPGRLVGARSPTS